MNGRAFHLLTWHAAVTAAAVLCEVTYPQAATATTTPAPVAHVYVQETNGVDLYYAAPNGALTLVKGSPFNIGGTWIEAARASYLFTFDANKVHSFAIGSGGVIGAEVDVIDTRNHTGAACGGSADMSGTFRGILDHTGQTLTVEVLGYAKNPEGGVQAVCEAYQSYKVSSAGQFTFVGAYVTSNGCCANNQMTFSGNDKYAYKVNAAPAIVDFERESSGALVHFNGTAQAPPPPPNTSGKWAPAIVDADPTSHAAVLGSFLNSSGGAVSPRKIASYTIGSSGDLTTNNTYAELVTPAVIPDVMNMSPSGKFLAVGGEANTGGLQIFHFNGAAPITPYSGVIGYAQVEAIHWDKSNHVYALDVLNRLSIYTVTSSGITQVPGSPYKLAGGAGGAGLLVIPTI
ncbi:MAG TPA: hypothetical protein VGJ21_14355 [Terracidiphilus sp.]|jgi:hypothetical protein